MKKIKNAVAVVIFVSAFLCACHENYNNSSANRSSDTESSSAEYITDSADDLSEEV